MKKISIPFLLFIVLCCVGVIPQTVNAGNGASRPYADPGDTLTFKKDVIELNEIPQGKPVTVEFEYVNNTNKPVIIADAHPGCGCTVASFDKAPIQPGKSGKITATYNAATMGVFVKSITVSFAGQQQKILTLKGKVV
jgi:hypothetical protein